MKNKNKGFDYNFLINNKLLNNSKKHYPSNLCSGNSRNNFLNNILYDIKDFDYIINQSTYELFSNNYSSFMDSVFSNIETIESIFYKKILVLLILL